MNKSTLTPLTKERHANFKLVESSDFTRFKTQHLIPIIAQDVYALSMEFPIVFVKNSESEEFVLVALMGFKEDQNLYCQNPDWQPHVVPVGFGNAPLSVALVDKDSDQYLVCIDETSPLVSQTQGKAMFSESGEKTSYLQTRIDSVVRIAEQTVQTQKLCQLFASKQLLSSNQLKIKHREDAPQYVINGIYSIDEKVLNKLSLEEFAELRDNGLLPIIYAQLTSLNQIGRLSRLQYLADIANK